MRDYFYFDWAVLRFCRQLRREGYDVLREQFEDMHLITASGPDGRDVTHYVAVVENERVCIEEVGEPVA